MITRVTCGLLLVLGTGACAVTSSESTSSDEQTSSVKVTVRVHYRGHAGELSLRGSGVLSWDRGVPLAEAEPGTFAWSGAVGPGEQEIEVKPLLGPNWSRGPNFHVRAGETVDIYPRFFETRGEVRRFAGYTSPRLPGTRAIWLYVPPTHTENLEARFPVLYMQDGQNLFSAESTFNGVEWQVDEALDRGAEDGTIRETIVVGIENTGNRLDELTPSVDAEIGGGDADKYLAMLIEEIKPEMDRDLRTMPDREHTGILGSSLGGLFSIYAGIERPDVFGLVGAMSPSTWWDNRMILDRSSGQRAWPDRPLRIYLDSGDAGNNGDGVANTRELADRYRAVGYRDGWDLAHYVQRGATHSERYWAQRTPGALRFILGPRPN